MILSVLELCVKTELVNRSIFLTCIRKAANGFILLNIILNLNLKKKCNKLQKNWRRMTRIKARKLPANIFRRKKNNVGNFLNGYFD